MCRQPIAPNVNAGNERSHAFVAREGIGSGAIRIAALHAGRGPGQRKEMRMSIRTAYPDIEAAEISLPGFVRERAGERGAAVPLMGPAGPDTATGLMGPADRDTVIPLMGPAGPGTSIPLMGPDDRRNAVPLMGPAGPGTATPLMYPRR